MAAAWVEGNHVTVISPAAWPGLSQALNDSSSGLCVGLLGRSQPTRRAMPTVAKAVALVSLLVPVVFVASSKLLTC